MEGQEQPGQPSPEELYRQEVNRLEDLADFHPAVLAQLDTEDREALSRFYFAGRDVDVDDVLSYRRGLMDEDPELEERAQQALRRYYERLGSESAAGDV